MPSKKPLINFVIDHNLLERVDDYRFTHRFTSRAAAIKFLIRWALDHNPKPTKDDTGDD